jgi:hypothetical protein
MSHLLWRTGLAFLCALMALALLVSPGLCDTRKPPPPKLAKPAKATAKTAVKKTVTRPATRTPTNTVRGATVNRYPAAVTRTFYRPFVANRSRTWYAHHWHRRWAYDVQARTAVNGGQRYFTNYAVARTFWHRLGRMHVHRRIIPTGSGWLVRFRASHWHRFGSYVHLNHARHAAAVLRLRGFLARVHWRHVIR